MAEAVEHTETKLDGEVRSWMAFAKQKVGEVALLAKAVDGIASIEDALAENDRLLHSQAASPCIHRKKLSTDLRLPTGKCPRSGPFLLRQRRQAEALSLPLLPTTTIGSFPQMAEVRKLRAAFRDG